MAKVTVTVEIDDDKTEDPKPDWSPVDPVLSTIEKTVVEPLGSVTDSINEKIFGI